MRPRGDRVPLPGYARQGELETIVAADPIEERRKSVEEKFCLRTYADFREMLDVEELDVVSLLVPPHVMEEMCGEVAGRGKPILCEKTLGEDIKTAERIAEVVARSGVALPVGL